jgi:tetratricopeptide (TPR) repeat protein
MAHDKAVLVPPPSPERRRAASGQFERANQVVATGNYDYAIRLLLSCCLFDPANFIYRQALRRVQRARYGNNLSGSWFAWLTAWPARVRVKRALRAKEYLKVLEHGERVLVRSPWHVGTQVDMAIAAEALGLGDLAVWSLEQARIKLPRDPALNRRLARMYEQRGAFTQAIVLWALVHKVVPQDDEAARKNKDLAATETITRGQYAAAVDDQKPAEQRPSPTLGRGRTPGAEAAAAAAPLDRVGREAEPLRRRLKVDPSNVQVYQQLAAVYRRAGQLEQARAILEEGLGQTSNAFDLTVDIADLEIEPFRRNLAIAEEKLTAQPEDPTLKKTRARLRKEINTRELELFRQKAERFPTELGPRFEVGVRLLRAGQVDEAIAALQAARVDPRCHWQSSYYLGQCFKERNNWKLARRNLEEALREMPPGEVAPRKDVLFLLASGCAEAGELEHAIELGLELANLDFAFRDIGRLLDEWQAKLKTNVN